MDRIEIVIIRPNFMIFGPNDILMSSELIRRIDEGKPIPTINHGKSKIGYVYVENLVDGLQRHDRFMFGPFWFAWPWVTVGSRRKRGLGAFEEPASVSSLVRPSDRIVLLRVKLESPGEWDFLGKLNPLDVIRQWVADAHERRKDKEYREAAERERLRLENGILENQIIRERIQIARELGATEEVLAPVLNELIIKPLNAVSRQQNHQLDLSWLGLFSTPHRPYQVPP